MGHHVITAHRKRMTATLPTLIAFGEALTDFVRVGPDRWHSAAGGACWNVARVAGTLGTPTAWAGAISDDVFGNEIVEKSRAAGLDMRFIQLASRSPLLAIVHQIDPPRYFFIGDNSADLAFDEHALPDDWADTCKIAHFGGISLVRKPLSTRLLAIAERLKAMGKTISFDPNHRQLMGTDYPPLFERMVSLANVIKVSDEDLMAIYPGLPVTSAISRVRALSPTSAILHTHGAAGMTLQTPDGAFEQPAIPVTVVDTVGAGDACIGGYLASLLTQRDQGFAYHLQFAAAAAAAACTRNGAHAPTLEETKQLLTLR